MSLYKTFGFIYAFTYFDFTSFIGRPTCPESSSLVTPASRLNVQDNVESQELAPNPWNGKGKQDTETPVEDVFQPKENTRSDSGPQFLCRPLFFLCPGGEVLEGHPSPPFWN